MKIKTSELVDTPLAWAVAKILQLEIDDSEKTVLFYEGEPFLPDTYWHQGGPIIEREWLDITPWPNESVEDLRWQCQQHDSIDCVAFGPTPLIAAMRCFVASRLGDEVDVPDEFHTV